MTTTQCHGPLEMYYEHLLIQQSEASLIKMRIRKVRERIKCPKHSHALKQLDFPPQNNGILWVFTAGNRNGEELGCSLWATCVMQMWKKNLKKEREREKHALTHKMRYSQRKYRSINVRLLRPTPCARFVHSFTRKINSNQNRQNLVEHNFWGGNKLLIKQTLRGDRIVSQTQNKV